MSVPMAIALSGRLLFGQPVMVKPSEAEKNLVQSTASGGGSGLAGPNAASERKLYVGNLHFNMTELQLRQVTRLTSLSAYSNKSTRIDTCYMQCIMVEA